MGFHNTPHPPPARKYWGGGGGYIGISFCVRVLGFGWNGRDLLNPKSICHYFLSDFFFFFLNLDNFGNQTLYKFYHRPVLQKDLGGVGDSCSYHFPVHESLKLQ